MDDDMCTSPNRATTNTTAENTTVAGIPVFVPDFHTPYYYDEVL